MILALHGQSLLPGKMPERTNVRGQTNITKFVVLRSTKNLAILIADSDSGWREKSKNTPSKLVPQADVLGLVEPRHIGT